MTTNQITINRDAVRSENLEQKNLTKQELNKTYYQFNQEKLKVKRRQRYLLNKNKSLTEQCSENKTEQSSKSEQTEQSPKIVQSKISEQNKKVEPEEVDDQVSRSEQFSPTEQKRTEQFPFFSEPSLTEQIVQTRTPTEHQDQTEQKKLNTEHPEQNFVQLEPKAEIYPPPEGISQLSEKIKAVVDTEEILQPDNTVVKSTEPESVVDQVVKKVEPEPAVVKIVKSSGLETPETILQLEAKILQLKEESAQEKAEKEK
jgi:hypothetical protein